MSINEDERKHRIESWEKLFLVQLAKEVDIEMEGNYFDYITGNKNWKDKAVLKRKYRDTEYAIRIEKKYSYRELRVPWYNIFFEGSRYDRQEESHRVQNPKAAVKFLESMVAKKEHSIDLLIARTGMRDNEQRIFTKMFGVPVTILNAVERNNYENCRRAISIELENKRTLSFNVLEEATGLAFTTASVNGKALSVEEVKSIIRTLSSPL